MIKCIKCEHYPWLLSADPGMMPPIKCHEKLEARKWTKGSISAAHSCPYFAGELSREVNPEPFVGAQTDAEPFVAAEANYSELTEKAKEFGIPFVGVKKEVLVAEIEALLAEGGEPSGTDS